MSSKQFKKAQDSTDTKKTSRELMLEKKSKSIKERELASLIAFVLVFGGLLLGVGIYSINYYNKTLEEQMIASVEDGYYYLPGHQFIADEDIDNAVDYMVESNEYPLDYKLKVMEYLHKQDYDKVDTYINKINEMYKVQYVVDDKTNVAINMTNANLGTINGSLATTQQIVDTVDFLKAEGVLKEDFELDNTTNTEGGITGINTKKAISYKNLHEAEVAYGKKLGLYMYVDALKNYEMINAFIIDDTFMQCVYAVNLDGSKITEKDLENVENIRTLTVKMSTLTDSADLKSVYKNYPILKSEKSEFGTIQYCGTDLDIVNLVHVDMPDKRSYVIHSADGIDINVAQNLMRELYGNLEQIKNTGEN